MCVSPHNFESNTTGKFIIIYDRLLICTQMYPPRYRVQMTQLRIADPRGLGRSLYRLRGEFPDMGNEYFLVSPPKEGSLFKLLIVNTADKIKNIIPLELQQVIPISE